MEILFELVFQVLGEAVLDGIFRLFGWSARSAAGVARDRRGREVVLALATVAAAFGGGWWWGDRLSTPGAETPRTLYVSLAIATAGMIAAAMRWVHDRSLGEDPATLSMATITPWQWSAKRLLTLTAANLALAAGVAVGFDAGAAVLR